ncbi:hypothetical protein Hdeb2414_s0005g00183321 [Helianthus debilis subsp. tardiflorus]
MEESLDTWWSWSLNAPAFNRWDHLVWGIGGSGLNLLLSLSNRYGIEQEYTLFIIII